MARESVLPKEANSMVWVQVGWKKFYETPVDESGVAIGPAKLVREEPIYADFSPQELELYLGLCP